MGAEFLKNTRETNLKNVNRGRADLAKPDLFTVEPECRPRRVMAKIAKGASVKVGEKVLIEEAGGSLQASVGNDLKASASGAPPDVVSVIAKSDSPAKGEIAKINKLSRTVEIEIAE